MRTPASSRNRRAFTLIELLVVIGIIGLLAVILVLTLNPTQLFKQSRDSKRLTEIDTLRRAIALGQTEPSFSFGSRKTIYVSVPDNAASSTQGTNCAGVGLREFNQLPDIADPWSFHCAASSTLRNIDGTGWLPMNFAGLNTQTPLSTLPVPSLNTTSSGDYFIYVVGANGKDWELDLPLESAKYSYKGSSDKTSTDGGDDFVKREVGNNLRTSPLGQLPVTDNLVVWLKGEGLDANGCFWSDQSGAGNHFLRQALTTCAAKISNAMNGWSVARFDGLTTYLKTPSSILPSGSAGTAFFVISVNNDDQYSVFSTNIQDDMWKNGSNSSLGVFSDSPLSGVPPSMPSNGTYIFSIIAGSDYGVYQNGSLLAQVPYVFNWGSGGYLGNQVGSSFDSHFGGDIAEVVAYNVALSDIDRQAVESYLNSKYFVY